MATPKQFLLMTLEDLGAEDFKHFKWFLQQKEVLEGFPSIPRTQLENADRMDTVDLMVQTYCINTIKVTRMVLVKMNQNDLVEHFTDIISVPTEILTYCQRKLKSNLKKKFQCVFEGISKAGNPTLLNQIYTELYITEGGTGEVNDEHEVRQIETASRKPVRPETTIRQEDIFKASPGRDGPIRTVMTKGVAGIGKTVLTQKFTLDWAEDKANQDIQFTFPFIFRELNVLKEKKFSLVELVHHFFTETKEAGICRFDQYQVVFIFDGLDECRLPLDFHNTEILTDVTESTSVDVLLTNLIRGKLLPSARLWITTRPAAANQIPPQCVDIVTEVRGFTDPQKEEYFRKRFRDEDQASRIISHIKRSQSLHIMCHIPVFCWITATVLKEVLKTRRRGELPKTLTEMYIHFLVVQSKLKNIKYDGRSETDPHWSPENRKMIESLGKLAFEQLQKGNLIFYESDLTECAIDIRAASVYSGVFTQIFKEERGLYQDKVFCFIHLSVQEFLAALHVHLTFINTGVNLMSEQTTSRWTILLRHRETQLYQSVVDKALESPNGHLDLFLRFLLGLSLQTNRTLLQGLMTQTGSSSETSHKTAQYIKKKMIQNLSPEKSINLFHCLNELNDCSLVQEIQQSLRSGSLSTDELSPAQWSALVFILLSSEKDLYVFDLKKYSASEEALLRLLPVVKASNKALLSGCNLSERSCKALSSVLSSQSSSLRDLDLSNNDLHDSGVKLLCAGLESPHCTLEGLRLSGCNLSERSCEALSSVLSSASSLRDLDLSNNNLRDSGVKLLCAGLESPHCTLEGLSLSGCLITEEGCASLASALSSNPSHLRELDLSYNHPGDSGVKLLSLGLEDPHWRLDSLRVGRNRVIKASRDKTLNVLGDAEDDSCSEDPSSINKGDSDVKLDLNTAETKLDVSEDDTKLMKPLSRFMPKLQAQSTQVSYRFGCPGPGGFRCTSTGLVFVMAQKAELFYRTIQWDEGLLKLAGKMAAGPLFEIQGPEDAVCQLHLPHYETKDALFSEDLLCVLHFTDDGMSILEPLEITDTHVIIKVPHLSAFGVVRVLEVFKRIWKKMNPISGQVLLFLTPPNLKTQNLNVLLLPSDIVLEEVRRKQPVSVYIPAPSQCELIEKRNYTVHCPMACKIQPEKAKFNRDVGPNYRSTFEIRLPTDTEEVTIAVRDETDTDVWKYDADLTGLSPAWTPSVPAWTPSVPAEILNVPAWTQGVSTGIANVPAWTQGVSTGIANVPAWTQGVPTGIPNVPAWTQGVSTGIANVPAWTQGVPTGIPNVPAWTQGVSTGIANVPAWTQVSQQGLQMSQHGLRVSQQGLQMSQHGLRVSKQKSTWRLFGQISSTVCLNLFYISCWINSWRAKW
ncbi:NLR family CARD domain-containing protein 3-like [Seriola aureovittata]|uniref:NLR family CARD domain-containing protein 3-like n=1 Tax=Seriola aureovittata TaxID=2871759 RepID=UPI0024BE575D|nr:NLR family CARD domain-containing protein 3-like [Seriola aureovittata]XP_056234359.1 NLR family CARD domain-containing protein 3-like [Seriola aureovittata]XP_056234360.1 NLR family CARD domain-containing protein 3-like [Seriola aureovittata]